jgi:hypothetical protein
MASLRAALSLGRHRVDTASDAIDLINRLHGAAQARGTQLSGTRQDARPVHDRDSGKGRGRA